MDNTFPLPKEGITQIESIVTAGTKRTGDWCRLPYPNHPKGCPNYNQKDTCPPRAPYISNLLDLRRPLYIVNSEFNLGVHMARMKQRHPHWTERQLRNVLYWQNTSRKQMRDLVKTLMFLRGCNTSVECPEGAGVNVYATCRANGIILQSIKDLTICRHVALVGYAP